MRARDIYQGRSHEPTVSEVVQWRTFAQAAAAVALGHRHNWAALVTLAKGCGKIRVFGHNTEGNVCILLVRHVIEAADMASNQRRPDELARLADEVLKRCIVADQMRQAFRHG